MIDNPDNTWVYYRPIHPNPLQAELDLHFSRNIDDPWRRDHMTAVQNGNRYHYFGGTRSVNNPAMPGNILTALIDAWADYFSVQPQEPPNQAESDQLEQLPHDEL